MSARDKYSSKSYLNMDKTSHVVQSTEIDFDGNSRSFREIYLNVIPSTPIEAEEDTESNPPNVRININIPANENTKKPQHRCCVPNIILSYNKQENLQISLSKNSKFQVKKIQQNRVQKLNRMVKLLAFRNERQEQRSKNVTIQLNLQSILDDSMLYSTQIQSCPIKRQQRGSKLYLHDYHVYSCSYESELDAYMRELKLRNEPSMDPLNIQNDTVQNVITCSD